MMRDQIPIGRFSYITRLSRKALRIYDEKGLLVPETRDRITGYRYYTYRQIAKGMTIKTLVNLGFSLDEVACLITAQSTGDSDMIREIVRRRREQVGIEIKRLQMIQTILEKQEISSELIPMMMTEPIVKMVEDIRIISVIGKGDYGSVIPDIIRRLCVIFASDEFARAGVRVTGPVLSLCHEEREQDPEIEIAFPVQGKIPVHEDRYTVSTLNGGTFLSLMHKGPYIRIHEGWSVLYTYAFSHGISTGVPAREVYLSDPDQVPEEELITELLLPVLNESASG